MIERVDTFLDAVSRGGRPYRIKPLLADDEASWFGRAMESGLVTCHECVPSCPRLRRWRVSGADEFTTPSGEARHLFSFPPDRPRLNREYIPHIAAWAKAILDVGYDPSRAAFSRYRVFARDAITRLAGTGYETDAEFYGPGEAIWLQVEAKRDARQVDAIAAQLDRAGDLRELPLGTVKEIEYVLELRPAHLWVVGPGSVDPPAHVFRVAVDGRTARFERLPRLPSPLQGQRRVGWPPQEAVQG
jgi:hypothetical protein